MNRVTHPNMVTRSRNRNHLTSFSTAAMVSTKGFLVGCSTLHQFPDSHLDTHRNPDSVCLNATASVIHYALTYPICH